MKPEDIEAKYLSLILGHPALPPYSEDDTKKLQAAYARANAVRDFEIQLYWNRTAYFWGFQVALFATAGLISQGILNYYATAKPAIPAIAAWAFLAMALISNAALAVSYIWLRMLSGAKFWQDNWERHIDVLEDHVTGPLYKSYFAQNELVNPDGTVALVSVTRANNLIAPTAVIFWFLASMASLALAMNYFIGPFNVRILESTLVTVVYLVMVAYIRDQIIRHTRSGVGFSILAKSGHSTHQLGSRKSLRRPEAEHSV